MSNENESVDQDHSQGNEEQIELDPEIRELHEEVIRLRQDTNFDINSSLQSAKYLLYEEYTKCIQVATTIFAVYSRSNQNQISVPSYNPSKQTLKYTKYFFTYKPIYLQIFSNPELFAEAIFDRILNEKTNVQIIAFETLPVLFGYYIDDTCCTKAKEFLISIADLINTNNKHDEIEKFQPIFESFFLGAYRFHDLLWSTFYNYYLNSNGTSSIFDLLLLSIKNAVLCLYNHLPVLTSLIQLSNDEGFKFIITGILKPSLIIYKSLFSGTDLFDQLLAEFQSIEFTSTDAKLQSIHNAFYGSTVPIQQSIDVTSIHFDQGLPLSILCGTFAKLIRLLKPADKVIEPIAIHFEAACKTLSDLEWDSKQTMSLPIFYPYAVLREFHPEKSSDTKMYAVWEQIKKNAEETSVDPLTLIPILNPDCDHITGITETSEFAKFALSQEIKELTSKKENLNYIIGLTMTYNSTQNMEKILESITKYANDTYLHVIMNDHLKISPNLRPSKISSTFNNVMITTQKMGLPIESSWIPSFITVLDNVTTIPSNRKLTKQFNNAKWNFKDELKEKEKVFEKIKPELNYLTKMINIIIKCPCGQQFWKLYELANTISTLQAICDESDIELSHKQIFAYVFPLEVGAEFINIMIRIFQIRKLFSSNDQFPQNVFEKIILVNSWLVGFLQTDKTFDVDVLSREISKPFS